jgi:uncharacterized protein (DUF302 family)
MAELFVRESSLSPEGVIASLRAHAESFGFVIRNVYDMKETFEEYGVETAEDFVYYSVMVCNPPRAYAAIRTNPLRGAVLLQPKQIVVYRDPETGSTQVAYMLLDERTMREALPGDTQWQDKLPASCRKIAQLIDAALQQAAA